MSNTKILNTSRLVVPSNQQKIFLGEYSGFQRYDSPKYQFAVNLENTQRNSFWNPNEIAMVTDGIKFPELPEHIQQIMIAVWLFQTLMDSGQNRGLDNILSTIVTTPEFESLFKTQGYFELIHSLSYSHILRGIFPDASVIFNKIDEYEEIKHRIDKEIEGYEKLAVINLNIKETIGSMSEYLAEYATVDELLELEELTKGYQNLALRIITRNADKMDEDKKKLILSLLIRVFALEGIKFYVSFLVTYVINNSYNNKIQGATRIIKLINFDEDLHVGIMAGTINILRKESVEGFKEIIDSPWFLETVNSIFNETYENEIEFAKYLMSFGPIPSLTIAVFESFLKFYVDDRVSKIGCPKIFNEKKSDIVEWFEMYKDINKDNTAQQEAEAMNYNIGILKNDIKEGVLINDISNKWKEKNKGKING